MSKRSDTRDTHVTPDTPDTRVTTPAHDTGAARGSDLRASPMMARLLDALENGTDVGHYGRLTFAMVARFFLPDQELIALLAKQPEQDEESARAMVLQVKGHDYNPPKRDRILQWQAQQDFQICPDPEDPNGCNVYRELRFPDHLYENIDEFWEEQAHSAEYESS